MPDNTAQAALDLPSAAELFPPSGRHSPAGAFADFCLQKIRAMLVAPSARSAYEWHRGFSARDRVWLCDVAAVDRGVAAMKWEHITAANRARLLATFERLRHWIQVHEEFSVHADIEEFAEIVGYKFSNGGHHHGQG